jgi:hypothetical protein
MLPTTVLRLRYARAWCATPAAIVTVTLTPFTTTSTKCFCTDLKTHKCRLAGEPIPDTELDSMPEIAFMADGEEKRRRMEDWVSNLDRDIGRIVEGDVQVGMECLHTLCFCT